MSRRIRVRLKYWALKHIIFSRRSTRVWPRKNGWKFVYRLFSIINDNFTNLFYLYKFPRKGFHSVLCIIQHDIIRSDIRSSRIFHENKVTFKRSILRLFTRPLAIIWRMCFSHRKILERIFPRENCAVAVTISQRQDFVCFYSAYILHNCIHASSVSC